MKKIPYIVLCFWFIVCLSGCSDNYPKETDMEYMVSSIGFDKIGENVSVFAEIMVVNSSSNEENAQTQIFSANGENAKTALYNLHSTLSKPLMLNHCGLLIIGDGIDEETLSEIFDICLENKNITGAIKVVATESAQKLIEIKALSNIAIGYEISEALKQNSQFSGIDYKNRFYEIEAKREGKTKVYALPFFDVSDEKHKIDGLKIYKDDRFLCRYNNQQAAIYSIVSNSFSNGEIKIDKASFKIKLKNVYYKIDYKNQKLAVNVFLKIETDSQNLKKLAKEIEKKPLEKKDIYYIADRIYKKDIKIWQAIDDDYDKIFKNAEVVLKVV